MLFQSNVNWDQIKENKHALDLPSVTLVLSLQTCAIGLNVSMSSGGGHYSQETNKKRNQR